MRNGRDNLLQIYAHKQPEYLPKDEDTFFAVFPFDESPGKEPGLDAWGVRWIPVPHAGQMVDEQYGAQVTDLNSWREQVKVPDPNELSKDWAAIAAEAMKDWNRETQMGAVVLLSGHFERMHALMGFEESLMCLYDDDFEDSIRDLFSEITKYKIKCLRIIKEFYDPDLVVYHDDWGHSLNMFFSPEVWRTFVKPEFRKIVEECHSLGMKFELHSCGHIQEVIPECVEIGIDSIQTLMYPQNDIRLIKDSVGQKLVIRGGYDGQVILRDDVPDEIKRKTIRHSLEILAPGGNHIPFFYAFGESPEHALAVFRDEVTAYETEHGPC